MMAGSGVSSGGAGMLRARRRDVSVKPNRKLDRKSSRGMIYENEELRLRTIHINAEVEQGQNDIKKLRRENEQLRREIWSLRDEYDKLEEILKSQKNREGSEEYEDRSEGEDKNDDEDVDEGSEYSGEEEDDEEEEEGAAGDDGAEAEEHDQEERLENAENQKISSEKMNNSLHRLHVEFDDLSVVDEEEEVKREKERKDGVSTDDKEIGRKKLESGCDLVRVNSKNGYQCFTAQYRSPDDARENYYPDCSYPCEGGYSDVSPINPGSILLTPCPAVYEAPVASMPNFETPGMTYESPIGWRNNIFSPGASLKIAESYQAGVVAGRSSGICGASMFALAGQSDQSAATTTGAVCAAGIPRGTPIDEGTWTERLMSPIGGNGTNAQSLLQRRNVPLKQPNCFYGEAVVPGRVAIGGFQAPNSAEALTPNGWDFGLCGSIAGNREMFRDTSHRNNEEKGERETGAEGREGQHGQDDLPRTVAYRGSASTDRPKHFFAPLPLKIQHGRQDSGDKTGTRTPNINPPRTDSPSVTYLENFGTGRSSSSDRTNSTVISAQHFPHTRSLSGTGNISDDGAKGSADICVNGAVPVHENRQRTSTTNGEQNRTYKSSENLLIGNADNSRGNSSSRQGSSNPLVKSISCQDLTSEQLQNSLFEITRTFNGDNKSQKLTKSDNTLDNPVAGSPKPFRSQLNVTLKLPGKRESPDTPEIPKLPSIDYRLLTNRFLKSFDPDRSNYGNYETNGPVTGPMSYRVNENSHGKSIPQPAVADYSRAMFTHSLARQLTVEESARKPTMRTSINDVENDRHRVPLPSPANQPNDTGFISGPAKLRQEFQVTSFEQPNPRSLLSGLTAFDLESLRRMPVATSPNPMISNHRKLYRNVPFVPGGGPSTPIFCPPGQNPMRMLFDNQTLKVPAQTQTSIDGGSNHEDDVGDDATIKDSKATDPDDPGTPSSPTSARRKRTVRKGRSNQTTDEKRPLSPAAQRRRLRKQSGVNVGDGMHPNKTANKTRKFSPATTTTTTTTTASDHPEDKNESRSSSSGQESPRKDHNRRVSLYFNSKKRPSLVSIKTTRSGSVDNTKEGFGPRAGDPLDTTTSERERTNSASSREAAGVKARKSSVSSGKVPWCACWGNGCI